MIKCNAIEHQEEIQILHYKNREYYQPHYDYFHDGVNDSKSQGGQRILTVLMYLYVNLSLIQNE